MEPEDGPDLDKFWCLEEYIWRWWCTYMCVHACRHPQVLFFWRHRHCFLRQRFWLVWNSSTRLSCWSVSHRDLPISESLALRFLAGTTTSIQGSNSCLCACMPGTLPSDLCLCLCLSLFLSCDGVVKAGWCSICWQALSTISIQAIAHRFLCRH